jgi:hypothetical protein
MDSNLQEFTDKAVKFAMDMGITNCRKGDPMQSKSRGSGGPTIRGQATVKSVN